MNGIKIRYQETMRHTQLGKRNVLYNEVYVWEAEEKEQEKNRF